MTHPKGGRRPRLTNGGASTTSTGIRRQGAHADRALMADPTGRSTPVLEGEVINADSD